MAWFPIAAAIVGTVLSVAGSQKQASAAKAAGDRTREAKGYEAAQLEINAGQAEAAGQRRSEDQLRRSRLVASRALAVSAASGGGASDSTIETIISDIAGEGAYRAGVELYQGEERARQLRAGADAALFEGEAAVAGGNERARAYQTQAFGSALSSGGSLYAKYGMGGVAGKDGYLDAGSISDPRFA